MLAVTAAVVLPGVTAVAVAVAVAGTLGRAELGQVVWEAALRRRQTVAVLGVVVVGPVVREIRAVAAAAVLVSSVKVLLAAVEVRASAVRLALAALPGKIVVLAAAVIMGVGVTVVRLRAEVLAALAAVAQSESSGVRAVHSLPPTQGTSEVKDWAVSFIAAALLVGFVI